MNITTISEVCGQEPNQLMQCIAVALNTTCAGYTLDGAFSRADVEKVMHDIPHQSASHS